VPKRLNIVELARLDKGSVCILSGTPYEERLQDWFAICKISFKSVMYSTQEAMCAAFYSDACDGVTQDISALASTIIASGKATDFLMLPDVAATDPLAPYVRACDDAWLDIVRWTHYAMIEAAELGITQATVEVRRQSGSPPERRLLGSIPGNGQKLGLDEGWAYNIVKQVGNDAECYDRNVGAGSPLKFGARRKCLVA